MSWRRFEDVDRSADYLSPIAKQADAALNALLGPLYRNVSGVPHKPTLPFAKYCYVQSEDDVLWDGLLHGLAGMGCPEMYVMVGDPGVGKTEYLSNFAFNTCSISGRSRTVPIFVAFETGGTLWRDKINRHIDEFIVHNHEALCELDPNLSGNISVFRRAYGCDLQAGEPRPAGTSINLLRPRIMRAVIESFKRKGRNLLIILDNVDQATPQQQHALIAKRNELHTEYPCPILVTVRPETEEQLREDPTSLFSVLPVFRSKNPAPLSEILRRRMDYLASRGGKDRRFRDVTVRLQNRTYTFSDFSQVLLYLLEEMQQPFPATPGSHRLTFLHLVTRLSNETSLTAALTHIITTISSGHFPVELISQAVSGHRVGAGDARRLIVPLVLGKDRQYRESTHHLRSGSGVINIYDSNLQSLRRGPLSAWLRPLCLVVTCVQDETVSRADVVEGICEAWPDPARREQVQTTIDTLLKHRLVVERDGGLKLTPGGHAYVDCLSVSHWYCQAIARRTRRDDEPVGPRTGTKALVQEALALEQFLLRQFHELTQTCRAERVQKWVKCLGDRVMSPASDEIRSAAEHLLKDGLRRSPNWSCSEPGWCKLAGQSISVEPGALELAYPNPWGNITPAAVFGNGRQAPAGISFTFDGEVLAVACNSSPACDIGCVTEPPVQLSPVQARPEEDNPQEG